MLEYLMPLFMILLGVIAVTIYVLVMALRDCSKQIIKINEKLIIMMGVRDGGEAVGRALVASSRKPKKDLPGVTKPLDKPTKKGLKMTVGVK